MKQKEALFCVEFGLNHEGEKWELEGKTGAWKGFSSKLEVK